MICNDKTIKELLPAYVEQALEQDELLQVERHLELCEDCRAEVPLLRIMRMDTVPDPGPAFWNEMPGRIYRAVQREKANKQHFNLSWLAGRIVLPRWVLASATIGIVLFVSLFAHNTLRQEPEISVSSAYLFSYDATIEDSLNIAALNPNEISSLDLWAANELASIAQEAEPLMATLQDTDMDDELAMLDATEIDRLSRQIKDWNEEV